MNSSLFEFFVLLGKLKTTRRTGWVRSGVNDPESIADHMYRMGMLSMIIDPSSGLDKDKCVKLSLVHDLAESIVGDITPNCGVSIGNKYLMEKSAMAHIKTLLPPKISDEIMDLWQEYEDQKTAEAKFVKDLDKFDMIFQAFEYEKCQSNLSLQCFFDSTKGVF
ncbi:hypothetical protein HELRODRAFT_70944 [Helobdella robusta]|uniref:5'-deoxynucleotidase HDDC2 n=1 Tax=Helobdella robusta TaxID=6412 RepID=T1G0E7_HELRO|nr:hypothetical protein HELRODRAFT_70944 [Helobdella robusta]ESN90697.1 hypothetical protein HELRODRAFT_70944 [Helobdella robusta]